MNTAKLKTIVIGIGLILASGAANATPVYSNAFETFVGLNLPGGFSGSGSASVTASSGTVITEFELLDTSVNKDETSYFSRGTISAGGTYVSFDYAGLNPAHSYLLEVEGCNGPCVASGGSTGGGNYTVVSSVPEPGIWAMMVAGLLGLIAIRSFRA